MLQYWSVEAGCAEGSHLPSSKFCRLVPSSSPLVLTVIDPDQERLVSTPLNPPMIQATSIDHEHQTMPSSSGSTPDVFGEHDLHLPGIEGTHTA